MNEQVETNWNVHVKLSIYACSNNAYKKKELNITGCRLPHAAYVIVE